MFLPFEPGVCLFCLCAPIFLGFDKPQAWESEKQYVSLHVLPEVTSEGTIKFLGRNEFH